MLRSTLPVTPPTSYIAKPAAHVGQKYQSRSSRGLLRPRMKTPTPAASTAVARLPPTM